MKKYLSIIILILMMCHMTSCNYGNEKIYEAFDNAVPMYELSKLNDRKLLRECNKRLSEQSGLLPDGIILESSYIDDFTILILLSSENAIFPSFRINNQYNSDEKFNVNFSEDSKSVKIGGRYYTLAICHGEFNKNDIIELEFDNVHYNLNSDVSDNYIYVNITDLFDHSQFGKTERISIDKEMKAMNRAVDVSDVYQTPYRLIVVFNNEGMSNINEFDMLLRTDENSFCKPLNINTNKGYADYVIFEDFDMLYFSFVKDNEVLTEIPI